MFFLFIKCKMYTFDQYFWLEITKQSIKNVINILCNDIPLMHTTYRPSILVFCFIKLKSKLLANVGVFNIIFRKTSTVNCFY